MPSLNLGHSMVSSVRYGQAHAAVVYSPTRLHTVLLSPSHGRYPVRHYLELFAAYNLWRSAPCTTCIIRTQTPLSPYSWMPAFSLTIRSTFPIFVEQRLPTLPHHLSQPSFPYIRPYRSITCRR